MRKDLLQKRERKQLQQKQQKQKAKETRIHTASENRPQRTHDDLMKDMERLKNALGIDSSIIEQQYFTMKLIKYKTLCGNLSTQEGRWTITI
jgi:glycine cleavage system protein P-like pyridoxal-binding family